MRKIARLWKCQLDRLFRNAGGSKILSTVATLDCGGWQLIDNQYDGQIVKLRITATTAEKLAPH
jgi:hypothetical protein